ncbi:MAG: EF-P lysine aminoacylase GenX [SAR324 cluster bacterium]|nr:EF-P lysine aminoacylase GenX [SAR324 cluster bacterium]
MIHTSTPTASERVKLLKKRSWFIKRVRHFFDALGYLEVDTPCLTRYPASEVYIDPICAYPFSQNNPYFLVTSPEYYMKRLLLNGSGAIYQIGSVFRRFEKGKMHSPEFTMLEWYAPAYSYQKIMQETADFLKFTLEVSKVEFMSFANCFKEFIDIDILGKDRGKVNIQLSDKITQIDKSAKVPALDFHEKLDYLMSFYIQPKLGKNLPIILYDFLIEPGTLAKPNKDDMTAARFEAYYHGIEISNGFLELTSHLKITKSLLKANEVRKQKKFLLWPIDDDFLQEMKNELSPTAGVALGIDRLLALTMGKEHINQVRNFSLN